MALPWIDTNPTFKLFIRDLTNIPAVGGYWMIDFGNCTSPRPVLGVQLQAEVVNLSGINNEILLVSDTTGKAKITCPVNQTDLAWLKIGSQCAITGALLDSAKIPHVRAIKISPIENSIQLQMWPLEVNELRNFLGKIVQPKIV